MAQLGISGLVYLVFSLVLLFLFCFHDVKSAVATDAASFYGASYVAVPLQDARSTTELHLRFRTRRADALLFLAAGRTDYCLVRLESGRLKVHINLGAGESEMSSAKGLRLDDLMWHDVVITRKDADMTVQVDTIHVTREKLPGRFYELNIHYGLFVGGQGDFSELFLGHLDNLRGCMADVSYNGVNVLARARERLGAVDVHGVTWSCAEEFDAGPERDISFVEDGAFVALPNAISRTGARWQLELKTGSRRGILIYNTGLSSRSDFVGVELENGRVRLLVDKGSGPAELRSETPVSDGRWHRVIVHFNPTYMEISVDGQVASMRLALGDNKYLDLAETVYVGGIELNKRARALTQGLRSAEESFKGCLRNMEVDGKKIGIPEARVTIGVLPDCVWEFPCARDEPCVTGARCFQHGVDSFRCECEQSLCVKPEFASGYKIFTKTSLPIDLEIVSLNPLNVAEGDNVLITPYNIDVVLDYPKFGVRDSGVIFRVATQPRYGRVQAEQSWQRGVEPVFTLLDMSKDKVRYVHDGSEEHADALELELELNAGAGFTLPGYLQGRHRFVLPINVSAVNDPPELIIPAGKVLRLAQGTKKMLNSDLLLAQDPDTPATELVYTVLSVNAGGKDGRSHLESSRNPGHALETFTQKEIDDGQVSFVHRGEAGSGRVALRVSDGIETGAAAMLRVVAFPLQLRLVNNTGLVMTHNTSSLIIPRNLAFVTNADEPELLEINYEITKSPQFGVLQRLRNNNGDNSNNNNNENKWQNIQHFTSFQLAREQIRYIHTTGSPTHDEFKFQVSAVDTKSSTIYDFRIIFVELRLDSVRNEELTLDGVQDGTIRSSHLHYDTVPQSSAGEDIVYHIARATRYGSLILGDGTHSATETKLRSGDSFTQNDITNGKLRYALNRRAYSRIHDDFTFRISTKAVNNGEASNEISTFSLIHVPGPTSDPVRSTLERLEVVEGGQQVISQSHLHLETSRVAAVSYNITRGPRHGRIDVLKSATAVARSNTSWFDSREISAEKVVYVHDDSESRRDSFHFLAYAPDFQYLGVFHFDIILKNDNKPLRTIDRVFRVVKGGERLLTGNDLKYEDADIDTKPEDIVYTRRGIPNGGIYSAKESNTPIFEFTQADLNAGRVLFRHDGGDEYGKVVLLVSDGDSYANGVLEVRASPPFVELVNNTGLIVQRSAAVPLAPANLSAETNVNARPQDMKYEILEAPAHGRLELDGERAKVFSEHDIEQGGVVYRHDGGNALKDHFRFRVDAAGAATAEGRFELRIFPAAYWEPLMITSNRTLHVEESTSVQIGPTILKVIHPQIPPSDITFIVQSPPRFGYLEVEPMPTTSSSVTTGGSEESVAHGIATLGTSEVTFFDQALVDSGRLHYVQAAANATRDHVIVDVTNGIWSIRGLWLRVVVVPKHVYVQGGELTVQEGGAVPLSRAHVAILTEYYAARVSEFRVVRAPKAGKLLLFKEGGQTSTITKFTVRQLEAGQVQYQHNGSEALMDQFSLIARVTSADSRDSLPATVKVNVIPVDDEKPKLVNNSGLSLYEGAVLVLKPEQIGATDVDSPPENITFLVSAPRGGFLSLRSAPRQPIERFTQAQLAARSVLFVHTGGIKNTGFHVALTDGVNSESQQHSVTVTVRELTLRLINNARLHVFPMLRQTLDPKQILAVTSDPGPPPRHIIFTVKTPPTMGRIITENSDGTPRGIKSFTQRDVNESRVWYEHTKAFTDFAANDSFVFDITSDFAEPLNAQVFRIDISVSSMTSDGLARFLQVEPITVDEGGAAALRVNSSGVSKFLESHSGGWTKPPVLLFLLTGTPTHGELLVRGGGIAEIGATFSQRQLDGGEVVYQHDHSDTEEDEILFSLILQGSNEEDDGLLLYNGTISVTINPVNDQPFSLRTNAPNMIVVQGQSKALTPEELLTEDSDTKPANIVYDVISGPSQGRLLLIYRQDKNGSLTERIEQAGRFSQEDINLGRLIYQHSGPLQPASFYFRVWDGHFNPVYTVFNIQVLKLNLTVQSITEVPIQQGSSVAFITSQHLQSITNGHHDNVKYNISRDPKYGKIYLRDLTVQSFGQADIEKRQVMYMQTDMTVSKDSFAVVAWIPGTDVSSDAHSVNVTVEPLLIRGNFTAIAGTKNRLGLDILDATPLAKLTNSNPSYEVVKKPRFGRIKKIIRITSTGEGNRETRERERDVTKFTHEEMKSGVIYYVARRGVDQNGAEESVSLLLSASIFQPAVVELRFPVRHASAAEQQAPGSGPTASVTPPRRGGPGLITGDTNGDLASPNMSKDYALILGVAVSVVFLAVCIIIAVKCRSNGRDEIANANGKNDHAYTANGSELMDTAPTLPRPPDHLLPLSPRPLRSKRFINANGSTHFSDSGDSWRAVSPIPVSIPQCKVIPLDTSDQGITTPGSIVGSEVDVNARYPYGSDEPPEDWSSYDTQSELPYPQRTTNPMLRRNQYWV